MKIISVVGARPNFMKIAPFIKAIENKNKKNDFKIQNLLVHTGQHYDDRMNNSFFKELNIPEADCNLNIGSGTHAEQVGYTMIAFERILKIEKPDWVVVVGDVNATCACSITTKKENIKLAHIEAGLRSNDMTMPEEINRLVTDRLSDLLLAPDRISVENLKNEGVDESKVKFVGNIMIDTLEYHRSAAKLLEVKSVISKNAHNDQNEIDKKLQVEINDRSFVVITMHRPSNVDIAHKMKELIDFLCDVICPEFPILWPVHPRTEKNLKKFNLWQKLVSTKNLILLNPIGYHEMLRLNMGARAILTDSGGLQEECCVLGTPCLTLRWNTERPVTLRGRGGASVLVGNLIKNIENEWRKLNEENFIPMRPELWDGKTAERIVNELILYRNE